MRYTDGVFTKKVGTGIGVPNYSTGASRRLLYGVFIH